MKIEVQKLTRDVKEVFANFIYDSFPVLLESQKLDTKLGLYSIIASDPFVAIRSKGSVVECYIDGKWQKKEGKPLDELAQLVEKYCIDIYKDLPFIGGALGYFSYDFVSQIEKIDITQQDKANIYDMYFAFYNETVLIDHKENELSIIGHEFVDNHESRFISLKKKVNANQQRLNEFYNVDVQIKNTISKDEYLNAIYTVKQNIKQGNVYQINYTQAFYCQLNKSPFTLYQRLAKTNPAPFAAYLDYQDFHIVSSSPERFMRVHGDKIETRPIKGTMARGETPQQDAQAKQQLQNSKKDHAELLMIVDLERNDMGRICSSGSVHVDELFHIEEYATVFQQVANVKGSLKPNTTIKDIINGTFPGGSITGAPKISAMQLIAKLEPYSRNIYTGSIGYISFNQHMDFNIAIRTILCQEKTATYQVGGGIIWDSDAQAEYEESLLKGKALKEALLWRDNESQ